jgi:hypothetical protein
MALQRQRSRRFPVRLAGALGAFLVSGCEAAGTPLGLSPEAAEQGPPVVMSVASLAGDAAQQAWRDGFAAGGEKASPRFPFGREPGQDVVWRGDAPEARIATAPSTSPGRRGPGPSASETEDEEARITSFGTDIRMPFGGPLTVVAYTTTSRATHITHALRITKTVGGRSYTTTLNDDSGFLNQSSLFTTVGMDGDCGTRTTIRAQTTHTAGSILVPRQFAASEDEASCGVPPDSCGGDGDGGGPDDVVVQGAGEGPDAQTSGECTGSGPGGEPARQTCYTVVTDYYWYYPDTGTYEYRYSEETTWCETATQ